KPPAMLPWCPFEGPDAMDFSFTPEQDRFRRDLQAFLAEPRVQDVRRRAQQRRPHEDADVRDVHRWLGERRWLAASWPEEYGGLGRTAIEAAIVHEELVR